MALEQARGSVEPRSDLPSLGAVLYELLVGALPFDSRRLRESGLVGIQNILRHEEPKKPSARLAELDPAEAAVIARHRETSAGKLAGLVGCHLYRTGGPAATIIPIVGDAAPVIAPQRFGQLGHIVGANEHHCLP